MEILPQEFIESLGRLGHRAYASLPETIATTEPSISVRLNPRRTALFPESEPVAWHPCGRYLSSRPQFTLDPRLHQGRYYVQDASSMAVSAAVEAIDWNHEDAPRVLDACAAPGGKTTALIDALPKGAFVVANEFDSRRAQVLAENLAKWGAEAYITRADASAMRLPAEFFDIIAADVPCSGEGMMRKDSFAVEQWSPGLVKECAARQLKIVDNLWDALRPGGHFIYSTCTFNLDENEKIVQHLIDDFGAESVELPLQYPGILPAMGGYQMAAYRFLPGQIRGEGLFLAMVRKPGEYRQPKDRAAKVSVREAKGFKAADYLTDNYVVVDESSLRAVRVAHVPLYNIMAKSIKPLAAGLEMGAIKGRDFIPSQQLALSESLRRDAFPMVEVDEPTALSYLRREAIALHDAPRGIVLLMFDGHPLGWVKNLGNRANNLYPEHWKIRK